MPNIACFGGAHAVRAPSHTGEATCGVVASSCGPSVEQHGLLRVSGRGLTFDRTANPSSADHPPAPCERGDEKSSALSAMQKNPPYSSSYQTCAATPGGRNHVEDETLLSWSMHVETAPDHAEGRKLRPCFSSEKRRKGADEPCGLHVRAPERLAAPEGLAAPEALPGRQSWPCFWIAPNPARPLRFFVVRFLWLFVYFVVVDIVMAIAGVSSDYFYMVDPQPKLKDRVHDWIMGGKPSSHLPQLVTDCLTVALVVITGVRHAFFVRMPLNIMIIYRFVAVLMSVYVLRTIAIFVTTMPAPDESCTAPDLSTAKEFVKRVVLAATFQVSLCTDMIISGHTLTTCLCLSMWLFYNNCNKHDDPEKDLILFYFLRDKLRDAWRRWRGRQSAQSRDGRSKELVPVCSTDGSVRGLSAAHSVCGHEQPPIPRALQSDAGGEQILRNSGDVGEQDPRTESDVAAEPDVRVCIECSDPSGQTARSKSGASCPLAETGEEFQGCELGASVVSDRIEGRQTAPSTAKSAQTFSQKEAACGRRHRGDEGGIQGGPCRAAEQRRSRAPRSDPDTLQANKKSQNGCVSWLRAFWRRMRDWNLLGVYCIFHGAVNIIIIDLSFCHYTVDITFGILVCFAIFAAYHMILSLLWAERVELTRLSARTQVLITRQREEADDVYGRNELRAPVNVEHRSHAGGCFAGAHSAEGLDASQRIHLDREGGGMKSRDGTARQGVEVEGNGVKRGDRLTLIGSLRGEAIRDPQPSYATAILAFPLIRIPAYLIRRFEGLD